MRRHDPTTTHSNLGRALDTLVDGGGPTDWGYVYSKPAPDRRPMRVELYPDESSVLRALRRMVHPRQHPQIIGLAYCALFVALLVLVTAATGSLGVGAVVAVAPFVLTAAIATAARACLAKLARPSRAIEVIACRDGQEYIDPEGLRAALDALIVLDARANGPRAAQRVANSWLSYRLHGQHQLSLTRPDLAAALNQCLHVPAMTPRRVRRAA